MTLCSSLPAKNNKYYNIVFFILSILIFYLSFASLQQNLILNKKLDLEYYNTDGLYYAGLCHDLIKHIPLEGKFLPNAPFLFPDLTIHCLINQFSDNIQLNIGLHYFFQILLIAITLGYIINLFIQNKSFNSYTYSLLFFALLFNFTSDLLNTQYAEFILNVLQYHSGVFWLELLSFIFVIKLFTNFTSSKGLFLRVCNYILYFSTIVLSIISDNLYSIQFTLPVFIILFYLYFTNSQNIIKNSLKNFCIINFLAFIIAYIISFKFILPHSYLTSLATFGLNNFFQHSKMYLAFLVYFCIIKIPLIILLFSSIIYKLKNTNYTLMKPLYFYWLIGFIINFILVFLLCLFSPYASIARYFIPFIILPLFIYLYKFAPYINRYPIIIFTIFILFIKPANALNYTAKPYIKYTPPLLKCIQKVNKQIPLYNGFGAYWENKAISLFSKGRFNIIPLYPNWKTAVFFNPNSIDSNTKVNFFIYKKCPPKEYCKLLYSQYYTSQSACFTFDQSCFNKQEILIKFGKPAQIFDCENNYQLFVYNNNLKNTLKLRQSDK